MAERLRADLVLEYPFTWTTGPVIGAFLTGLREGIILGIRRPDGTVLCPPTECDPESSEPLTELVEVGPGGELSSNPIGASGMIRIAEAAIQVRGMAGDHQAEGARKAFGHAYGGGAQYYAMWIVGSDKPTS